MLCDARPGTLSAISPECPPAAGAIKEVVTPPYRDIGRSSSGLLQEKGLNMFRSSARRHAFILSQNRAVSEGRCIFSFSSQQLLSHLPVCVCVDNSCTIALQAFDPYPSLYLHAYAPLCCLTAFVWWHSKRKGKKNRPVSPLPLPRTNLPSQ